MKLLLSILALSVSSMFAKDEKNIADTIADEMMSSMKKAELIEKLTEDQIPKKFISRSEDNSTGTLGRIIFYRGLQKVCEVHWLKSWQGVKKNDCLGTIYNNDKAISHFNTIDGTHTATTVTAPDGYTATFIVTPKGVMIFSVSNKLGFFQSVRVDGRRSRLQNDLQYTKDYYNYYLTHEFSKKLRKVTDEHIKEFKK